MTNAKEKKATTSAMVPIMRLNKPEWPQITCGCISSVIMGCAMPLFAVLFGEIIGVLAEENPEDVRAGTNKYSLYFVITGIVVGLATFLQVIFLLLLFLRFVVIF